MLLIGKLSFIYEPKKGWKDDLKKGFHGPIIFEMTQRKPLMILGSKEKLKMNPITKPKLYNSLINVTKLIWKHQIKTFTLPVMSERL